MIKNLEGLRVLNTRPLKQGKILSAAIHKAGGLAIDCPALTIEATNSNWFHSLPAFDEITQAIFTSANAVDYFFAVLRREHKVWPKKIIVIAVGRATALSLRKQGVETVLIPTIADSEHLLILPTLQQIGGQTILLIKGEEGRTLISENLLSRAANLVMVEVYKRCLPTFPQQGFDSLWRDEAVDIILFTSQQAMHNIFAMFGKEAKAWLQQTPCVVISQRLAQAATNLGIRTIIVASPETLFDRLEQFNKGLIHGE